MWATDSYAYRRLAQEEDDKAGQHIFVETQDRVNARECDPDTTEESIDSFIWGHIELNVILYFHSTFFRYSTSLKVTVNIVSPMYSSNSSTRTLLFLCIQ